MLTSLIFFIEIILFITLFVYMINGNIKAKKLIKILPKEKLDSLKFGTGYNTFKVCRYIMSDDISDTQEIIEEKNRLRPIIKRQKLLAYILAIIFIISLMF